MVSIIIPVYNTERYLCQCLDSVLCQTWQDIEVICVDDGSTDKSSQILDDYAGRDSRVRVIHKENAGLVSARKTGLQAASGEYIGYVDSDDWIEPDMYKKLFHTLTEENVDVVMCGRYEDAGAERKAVCHGFAGGRYDKAALIEKVYPNMIVNEYFFEWGIFPSVWDKLFRRECLERFQMAVDERLTMGEDAACVYPCLLEADSIYILQECLYHYRQSVESMVRQRGNIELARMRFHVLYQSVLEKFEQDKATYDLCSQWRDYLLFLMVPRADALYHGMEELEYLFPFPKVKKGSRIILYGMGLYGQCLYRFLKNTGFCSIAAAADRNYAVLQEQGFPVISPEEIDDYEYDAVVVTASFYKVRMRIYEDLCERYQQKKIHIMDEAIVKCEETLRAFGLLS